MVQPLGTRLAAEALGTFMFFFLGFSGIAIVVEIGADAITPLGIAAGFGFGLALAITAFGTSRAGTSTRPSGRGSPSPGASTRAR